MLGEEEGEEGENDGEKRRKEEEELKKLKERQAFRENLYVLICMIIIVALAVVCVIVKIVFFHSARVVDFIPLDQKVRSTIKYTGEVIKFKIGLKILLLQETVLFHAKVMCRLRPGATTRSTGSSFSGPTTSAGSRKLIDRKYLYFQTDPASNKIAFSRGSYRIQKEHHHTM